MKKILTYSFALIVLLCGAGVFAAPKTDVYIGITSAGGKRLPTIAMPRFQATGEGAIAAAQTVYDTLRADILYARYFDVSTDGPAFEVLAGDGTMDANKLKNVLSGWSKKRANYLIGGEVIYQEPYYTIKLYVYDVASQSSVFAKAFKGTQSSLRLLAHRAADQIIQTLTGHRGIAETKIAFANNSTKHKEIYVVDYDGKNLKQITYDKSIALLPRWSKEGRIYYTTYKYRNPDIFSIDLKAGKIAPVIIKGGLSLIGGVSPNGKALVFTSSKGMNPSIYLYNLETGEKKQITNKQSVDGSPSYSPDGRYITFVSNRAGNPQIYVMELETGQTRPLTKTFNWSDTPQWSPTGEWIAFAGRESPYHPFDIFLVDLTGTQLRRLTTDAGTNEDPTWSPDGRFIAFTSTRDGGRRKLYVMDSDGSAPHLIADLPGDSFTPHWSF